MRIWRGNEEERGRGRGEEATEKTEEKRGREDEYILRRHKRFTNIIFTAQSQVVTTAERVSDVDASTVRHFTRIRTVLI